MNKKNDLTSFMEKFGTEEKCFKHLCEFKWAATSRSRGKRQRIQMAVEIDWSEDGPGNVQIRNASARVVVTYSSDELAEAMDKMIDPKAIITSDEWRSYPKAVRAKTDFAEPSDKGESMPQIHRMVFNLKNWIRGIHHRVLPEHLQSYLDEFFFRFNKRNQLNSISKNLRQAMVIHQWFHHKSAIAA